MSKPSKNTQLVIDIIATAAELGWKVFVREGVLSITKSIPKDDDRSFSQADMEYSAILDLAPSRSGSQWGTDGSGMGAVAAKRNGLFVMNKSGVSKLLIRAIEAWVK